MYEGMIAEGTDHEEATLGILKYKEKQLESLLFLKADYIQNVIRASRTGPMDAFVKKR
jgi:hypothetical protein